MNTASNILHLSPADVAQHLQKGGTHLIDVREPAEHAAERIEGATLHPLSSFDPAKLPAGEIIFHCGSGKRSQTAIELCRAAGLAHHAHLAGGVQAWKLAGMPTKRG